MIFVAILDQIWELLVLLPCQKIVGTSKLEAKIW